MSRVIKKTWLLLGEVTRHDIDMLHRAGADVQTVRDDHPAEPVGYLPGGTIYKTRDMEIYVTTTLESQETVLSVCFGDRLVLNSVSYGASDHKYY